MNKQIAIGSTPGYRARRTWRRLRNSALRAPTALLYALFGLVGVALWVLMHLPVGARAKSTLVYAMAGCVGLFTMGWRMLRAQAAGVRR